MTSRKATVIGYGRFGSLWASLLKKEFSVVIVESDFKAKEQATQDGYRVSSLEEALKSEVWFYCVPIAQFREILKAHAPLLKNSSVKIIFDCLSVKVEPKKVFDEVALSEKEIGLLHPLFGPDSVKANGLQGLPISMDPYSLKSETKEEWIHRFRSWGLTPLMMDAETHDRLAAYSQGLTHYIGRILGELDIAPSIIDTIGAKKLLEVKDQVCNDSIELFNDLQQYNPFTLEMRIALGKAQQKIYRSLLPNRITTDRLVIGIQGGPGSFNEEAAHHYIKAHGNEPFKLLYLYTSESVLQALYEGRVDRGVFAIHNSLGGIVDESVTAMSLFNFSIIEEFSILISHCLLTRKDVSPDQIDTIMGHPQALKQCVRTLRDKFPNLSTVSGKGASADPSKASEELVSGTVGPRTAILGSRMLASVFDLKVIEENLQDLRENYTSFLWVQRPHL